MSLTVQVNVVEMLLLMNEVNVVVMEWIKVHVTVLAMY